MPATCSASSAWEKASTSQALDDLAALLLGQERAQRMGAMQLVAAVGADQQQALVAQAPYQRGEELERRAVGPVQVLDGEDDGRLGGQPVQQRAQQAEEPGLGQRLAGAGHALAQLVGPVGRAELGQQPREVPACGADQLLEGRRIELARQPAQGGRDGRVGQAVGAEGQAVAAQHPRAALRGHALELAQQPRLAHAGVPAHEDRRRRAVLGPVQRGLQAGKLCRRPTNSGLETRAGTARLCPAGTSVGRRFTRVPRRCAAVAASTRERTPSLARIRDTCDSWRSSRR